MKTRAELLNNIQLSIADLLPQDGDWPNESYLVELALTHPKQAVQAPTRIDSISNTFPNYRLQLPEQMTIIAELPVDEGRREDINAKNKKLKQARQHLLQAMPGLHIITREVLEGIDPSIRRAQVQHFADVNMSNGPLEIRLFEGELPAEFNGATNLVHTPQGAAVFTDLLNPRRDANGVFTSNSTVSMFWPVGDQTATQRADLFNAIASQSLTREQSTKAFLDFLAQ